MKYPIIVLVKLSKALGSLFLLASLVFVSPASAGGGPVYISAGSSLSSWNSESRNIIAKVHLHPDVACIGTKITFKYENQKDDDSVSTGAEGNTYTISEVGARWLNGKSVYDCGTYAKYISKNRQLKTAVIVVTTPKGVTYERKIALNFQSNEPIISSDDSLPWDNEGAVSDTFAPKGEIYIKVGNQRYVDGPKRYVTLSWNKVEKAVKYNVYTRLSDTKYGAATVGTGSLSTEVGINAFLDYSVKVEACNSAGCVSSNEVFVPKMKKEEGGTVTVPSPSTVTTPSTNDYSNDELNKKIENLQNQLEQSQQRQNILEQRINDLLNFIKKLFPFFN